MNDAMLHLKRGVARLICRPWIGQVLGAVLRNHIPNYGRMIDTSSPLVTPTIKAMIFWRLYENAEITLVRRFLRRDLDIVELGSSLGVVSSHIAHLTPPAHKLICVEANPQLVDIIRTNVHLAAPSREVWVQNRAIAYGTADSEVSLRGDSTLSGRITAHKMPDPLSQRVKAVTLSQILAEHSIQEYALVADIEGAEWQMFQSDGFALQNCRQVIIELHDAAATRQGKDIPEMLRMLKQRHGFAVRATRGNVFVFEK